MSKIKDADLIQQHGEKMEDYVLRVAAYLHEDLSTVFGMLVRYQTLAVNYPALEQLVGSSILSKLNEVHADAICLRVDLRDKLKDQDLFRVYLDSSIAQHREEWIKNERG